MAELDPDQAPVMQDIRAAAVLLMKLVCGIKYRTFAHTHLLERRDWQLLHVAPQQWLQQMRSGGDKRCGSEPAAWHTRAMQLARSMAIGSSMRVAKCASDCSASERTTVHHP